MRVVSIFSSNSQQEIKCQTKPLKGSKRKKEDTLLETKRLDRYIAMELTTEESRTETREGERQ